VPGGVDIALASANVSSVAGQNSGEYGAVATTVIASEAKQSMEQQPRKVDCFVTPLIAMTASADTPKRPAAQRCPYAIPVEIDLEGLAESKTHSYPEWLD
jgi:hypothetical protein